VLLALRVDDEAAQATARNEGGVVRHFAGALQEVARRETAGDEHRLHEREILRREGRTGGKVSLQDLERGRSI
jgi:hypothetical protein